MITPEEKADNIIRRISTKPLSRNNYRFMRENPNLFEQYKFTKRNK